MRVGMRGGTVYADDDAGVWAETAEVLSAEHANMGPMTRISRKIAAITESATLAVDAKAKALQAAGEHVIGFGAGRARLPDARARSSRPPSPRVATPATTSTRPRPGCPSCARRSR